ncbi:MAG TPA: rhomboid family intramembrane serine protease [Terriglobales bacterium]|nr:rhomboid family intramembrane serine protease [Terriglobales bacterium]
MSEAWIEVARAPRRQIIEDLALVLEAEGVANEVCSGGGWGLRVPARRFGDAAAVLAAYERDQVEVPVELVPPRDYGASQIGVSLASALLAFHTALIASGSYETWVRRGRVSFTRVVDGELWRCVTALTLHSGAYHLASNAVACIVFGGFLGRAIGAGGAVTVMLLAGALGNGLNVLWRGGPHLSIGASTAVFGAVGALAALQARRYRLRPASAKRAWLPLAAGVGLLAMLGASPESDFIAHLCGMIAGVGMGVVADRVTPPPPARRRQSAALVAATSVVMISWWLALRSS